MTNSFWFLFSFSILFYFIVSYSILLYSILFYYIILSWVVLYYLILYSVIFYFKLFTISDSASLIIKCILFIITLHFYFTVLPLVRCHLFLFIFPYPLSLHFLFLSIIDSHFFCSLLSFFLFSLSYDTPRVSFKQFSFS